jgi:uncharacterized protein YggE
METPTTNDIRITPPEIIVRMAAIALGMLALFLLVLTGSAFKSYHYIGSGISASNIISVTGEGEVFAVPDSATFTYSVAETAADVKSAQDKATQKTNDILAYLKEQGIEGADIQTTDYNVNPQYQWSTAVCPSSGYCPPGKQTISGYEVAQAVTVKVKDTSKAGTILAGVGSHGASNVSGLTFGVADQKGLEAQARDKAITDAREQANKLASSLGVQIVRVVGFSENGSNPMPLYAKAMTMSADSSAAAGAAPSIPTGQNKITSSVSISYEIQ